MNRYKLAGAERVIRLRRSPLALQAPHAALPATGLAITRRPDSRPPNHTHIRPPRGPRSAHRRAAPRRSPSDISIQHERRVQLGLLALLPLPRRRLRLARRLRLHESLLLRM